MWNLFVVEWRLRQCQWVYQTARASQSTSPSSSKSTSICLPPSTAISPAITTSDNDLPRQRDHSPPADRDYPTTDHSPEALRRRSSNLVIQYVDELTDWLAEKHHSRHPFSLLCLVRDDTSLYEQRKSSSKIIANLTTHSADEQPRQSSPPLSASQKLQTQLSVQDTIQRHFCQILKNDSLTVTDKTSITETILMRENGSSNSSAISECFQSRHVSSPLDGEPMRIGPFLKGWGEWADL